MKIIFLFLNTPNARKVVSLYDDLTYRQLKLGDVALPIEGSAPQT